MAFTMFAIGVKIYLHHICHTGKTWANPIFVQCLCPGMTDVRAILNKSVN